MKKLLLFLLFSLPSFADCIAVGRLHLVPPYTTVYCQEYGVTEWAVTYGKAKNQWIIYNAPMKVYWYVPADPLQRFLGAQTIANTNAWYTMAVGALEDDHWVFVNLDGHSIP